MDYEERFERLYVRLMSWIDEFSHKTKVERDETYENYRWMFSDDCKNLPTLEPLISDANVRNKIETTKQNNKKSHLLSQASDPL